MPQPNYRAMIAALESHGLSRGDIAQAAGVSRATIWRMQNDPRDHMAGTVERVERVERLHQRIVSGAEKLPWVTSSFTKNRAGPKA